MTIVFSSLVGSFAFTHLTCSPGNPWRRPSDGWRSDLPFRDTYRASTLTIALSSMVGPSIFLCHHARSISILRPLLIPRRPFRTIVQTLTGIDPLSSPISKSRFSSFNSDRRTPRGGEIHVILGPMFAGKTTALIERIKLESYHGRRTAVVKSNKDNRYGLDSLVSHDGVRMPCWSLPELSIFPAKIGAEAYNELEVIGIDEAQFFGDLYDFCNKAADYDGKVVIVAGLDGDYLRRSFGSVLDIIPLADSVTKLTARCELCGQRAPFTLRKTAEVRTELIGGSDIYMPICRRHYMNGQVVIESPSRDDELIETQKLEA